MIIKKFQGKTEEEAVEAAKKELGNGIVIMNVKNVKRKGIFAFFCPGMVEVTVALEDDKDVFVKKPGEIASVLKGGSSTSTGNKISLSAGGVGTDNIEKKLDSLQILLENQLKKQEEEKLETNGSAGGEKKETSVEPAAESVTKEQNSEQEKFIRLLYNTMIDNEVDEKYANQILAEIEKNKKPNHPMDYILAGVYQRLILKCGKTVGITPAENGPKVVAFVGPTGVGKTTTIAKVASRYVVEEKKKVALLTADTYRIAAAEQLRTYANILEVPFRVIYTEEEVKQAIQDFKEYDYIFLDTTGHSHQNEEQITKTKAFLDTVGDVAQKDVFLVLSATTKYEDLLKIAKNYKTITEYQLIFTKLDETTTVGNLLNVKLYTDVPIAYVTNGQNVPNDIEKFNPQKMVKQLLGGH